MPVRQTATWLLAPGPCALPIATPLPCAALCAVNLCTLCASPSVSLQGLLRNRFSAGLGFGHRPLSNVQPFARRGAPDQKGRPKNHKENYIWLLAPGPSALPIAAALPCAALCAVNLCSLCAFPSASLLGLVRNKFVQLVRRGLAKTLPAQGRPPAASGHMTPLVPE